MKRTWAEVISEFEVSEDFKRIPVENHYHAHFFNWMISNYFPPTRIGSEIVIGNIRLNPISKEAFLANDQIYLTKKEFAILFTFMKDPNKIHTRDELMNSIWKDVIVEDRTINVHICNIRKKFRGEFTVETITGIGYKLNINHNVKTINRGASA